jgi:hypothetical protein
MKIDTSKLKLLPVPEGLTMKYRHFYKMPNGPEGPKRLDMTTAWLEDAQGKTVFEQDAMVNPKDVPIKKLGRAIAHNRCIKAFHKSKQV